MLIGTSAHAVLVLTMSANSVVLPCCAVSVSSRDTAPGGHCELGIACCAEVVGVPSFGSAAASEAVNMEQGRHALRASSASCGAATEEPFRIPCPACIKDLDMTAKLQADTSRPTCVMNISVDMFSSCRRKASLNLPMMSI